jgi:hypothetical protein
VASHSQSKRRNELVWRLAGESLVLIKQKLKQLESVSDMLNFLITARPLIHNSPTVVNEIHEIHMT